MSEKNPLHVSFTLPDEQTAQWLDLLIARAGGDPDLWFAQFLDANRRETLASSGRRLQAIANTLADSPREQRTPPARSDGQAPPRPAHTRAVRGSSDWRTR